MSLTQSDIEKAVADLFVNGQGKKASRLLLIDESHTPGGYGWDLGGLCQEAVVSELCKAFGVKWKFRPREAAPTTKGQ